jgi:hypothetical protein
VGDVAQDCLGYLSEEIIPTTTYVMEVPRVEDALDQLSAEFSPSLIDEKLLGNAMAQRSARVTQKETLYDQTVCRP